MLSIDIKVNHKVIDMVRVINDGPPSDVYEEGDGPGGGGERRYRWASANHGKGHITHARSDGAIALAVKVLSAIDTQEAHGG